MGAKAYEFIEFVRKLETADTATVRRIARDAGLPNRTVFEATRQDLIDQLCRWFFPVCENWNAKTGGCMIAGGMACWERSYKTMDCDGRRPFTGLLIEAIKLRKGC